MVEICARFPKASRVDCASYSEVFNPRGQNFRLQKRNPALILAAKHGELIHQVPTGYGLGGRRNYYFSHMLNCVYDCRYCFLQGMFRSAHYVVFVNYDDFVSAIQGAADDGSSAGTWFYSGYDCDSLALEPMTRFMQFFLPRIRHLDGAWLELRTKSTQIRTLLELDPLPNVIVAYSFTPDEVSGVLEHKVPPLCRRLAAMSQLQSAGWRIGLRFDPLIYHQDFREQYLRLFRQVFAVVDETRLHSVTLGPFRMPRDFHRIITRHYPAEPLFAGPMQETDGMVSYPAAMEQEMLRFCSEALLARIPETIFHTHTVAG